MNEDLGIAAERKRKRERWSDFVYRAPSTADAKETRITVDLATGERTIEQFVSEKIDASLKSEAFKKKIEASLEEFIQQAIAKSESMEAWRQRRLEAIAAGHLPEVDYILQIVSEVTTITIPELRSPRRARALSWPRHLACWLICKLRPDLSLPRIGQLLGNRDHTTIMHGRSHVDRKVDVAPFKQWLEDERIIALVGEKP